jgi:hypothetical protein
MFPDFDHGVKRKTKTRDWAAGFNSVQITKAEGSPGAFTNVEVEFTK